MSIDETTPAPDQPGERLTNRDRSRGVRRDHGGMRAAISNAMVSLKKDFYGKGPEAAKTYINDNFVFCVLEGGVTRNERTLLDAGEEGLVRQYRLRFQAAMTKATTESIAQITGRQVISYQSQIVFDPDRGFEIFELDAAPEQEGQ